MFSPFAAPGERRETPSRSLSLRFAAETGRLRRRDGASISNNIILLYFIPYIILYKAVEIFKNDGHAIKANDGKETTP